MNVQENLVIPLQMIDTNIVLRFLLNDSPDMSQKAKKLFERASNAEINLVICETTFIELVFVLEKVMKLNRSQIAPALRQLLKLPGISTLTSEAVLVQALDFYDQSRKPWPDCVIAASAIGNKIEKIYSFDHHFDSFEGLTRLKP